MERLRGGLDCGVVGEPLVKRGFGGGGGFGRDCAGGCGSG